MHGHLEVRRRAAATIALRLTSLPWGHRWMFDCCCIPGQNELDWSVTYAKEGDRGTSGHVIVLRKGRVWKLDAWQDGRLLSVAELEQYVGPSGIASSLLLTRIIGKYSISTITRRRSTLGLGS